mgnify:CR=1 FL=1
MKEQIDERGAVKNLKGMAKMRVYKIVLTKTVFVEAETEEEAKEVMFDEEEMMIDERIKSIDVSSRKEMRQMMLGEDDEQREAD